VGGAIEVRYILWLSVPVERICSFLQNAIPTLIVTGVSHPLQLWASMALLTANLALAGHKADWAIGALLTVAFALLAHRIRGVTTSGAIAGAISCFVLYAGGGPSAFVALITVFALAWITTRLGYQRKQTMGTAERREGRKGSQVLANLGVATACAALSWLSHRPEFLLAMAAALSEAAADTTSSEVGQALGKTARLVTTWSPVTPGTNGAVSLIGTSAGAIAAGIVTVVCILGGLLPWRWLPICVISALLGMFLDSFLGAWLERRRLINNDLVNFLGTLISASAAFWLAPIT
jgi:uncharacterized protein (TIGR00297 family)